MKTSLHNVWQNAMNWEFKIRSLADRRKTIFHMHGDDSFITIAFITFCLHQNHNNNNARIWMGLLALAFRILIPIFFFISLRDARCKSDIHHQSANIFHLEFFHVYYLYCYSIKGKKFKLKYRMQNATRRIYIYTKAREECKRTIERKALVWHCVICWWHEGEHEKGNHRRHECMTCMKLWNFQWYALRVLWLIVSLHRRQIE